MRCSADSLTTILLVEQKTCFQISCYFDGMTDKTVIQSHP
jgi:hypothetical protein